MEENSLDPLKKFVGEYKQAQQKFQRAENIADVHIEKNKVKEGFESKNEEYVTLIRKIIDFDNPKRKLNQKIEELSKKLEVLQAGYNSGGNDPEVESLTKELSSLKENLSNIESEEMMTHIELDPIDEEKRRLDIESQVLDDKGKDMLDDVAMKN